MEIKLEEKSDVSRGKKQDSGDNFFYFFPCADPSKWGVHRHTTRTISHDFRNSTQENQFLSSKDLIYRELQLKRRLHWRHVCVFTFCKPKAQQGQAQESRLPFTKTNPRYNLQPLHQTFQSFPWGWGSGLGVGSETVLVSSRLRQ